MQTSFFEQLRTSHSFIDSFDLVSSGANPKALIAALHSRLIHTNGTVHRLRCTSRDHYGTWNSLSRMLRNDEFLLTNTESNYADAQTVFSCRRVIYRLSATFVFAFPVTVERPYDSTCGIMASTSVRCFRFLTKSAGLRNFHRLPAPP